MRLFVTGATGVVGRRAVPLLLSQGHSVTAGVRQTASRVGVAQKELDYVPVDLFDLRELRRAVAGHDAIINLATQMPSSAWSIMSRSSWRENDRIRTEGVANLVEAARRNGISRFVQSSLRSLTPTAPTLGLMSKRRSIPPLIARRCPTPRDQSPISARRDTPGLFFGLRPSMDPMQCR